MTRRKRDVKITADGSIIDAEGKVLFFSLKRFRRDIVDGDCCFLCGVSPKSAEFNDEHVVPDWILKELGLHNKLVGLPNSHGFLYSKYKVPCCVACNSRLGESLEAPISRLFKRGYQAVCQHALKDGPWLFYVWLALIFLKTHLKDRTLRFHIDKRKGADRIADLYDWNTMHHIHCVVRAAYTGAALDRKIMGSFFLLNAKMAKHIEAFDYVDLFFTKTICLRFNDIVIYCVLDDACATYTLMKKGPLSKIAGPLSPVQIREVLARIAYTRSLVANGPKFFTTVKDASLKISAKIPKFVETEEGDPNRYAAILNRACGEFLERSDFENKEFVLQNVRQGRWTFLFDENGRFLTDSFDEIAK